VAVDLEVDQVMKSVVGVMGISTSMVPFPSGVLRMTYVNSHIQSCNDRVRLKCLRGQFEGECGGGSEGVRKETKQVKHIP